MVGGGEGAFIGALHRQAARLDGEIELVCGAFSSDPARSAATGRALSLPAGRCYPDYATMFRAEAGLPADERMQFVAIVTPNHLHLPVALAALEHGFHVLSDKPATVSLEECRRLAAALGASGRLYALTHPYAAYPLVREAAARIAAGELGTVRKVVVEYAQGWLATPLERTGHKQASWRLDPARGGPSGCFGDIGVHAFNLAEHVTGLEVTEICCELNRVVPGRALDDDGTALLRFDNGAHGVLLASQISVGEENALTLRVYGDAAGLEWRQEEPNTLLIKRDGGPAERLRAGHAYLGAAAQRATRLPAGHPEGYIEAFANLYREFAAAVRAFEAGERTAPALPGIREALRGMAFIETALAASASPTKWHRLEAPA
ncbi:MAG TPA: Gfo/Idh/MocA family oxidoreductase [Gammaproteobacteria bacterium]